MFIISFLDNQDDNFSETQSLDMSIRPAVVGNCQQKPLPSDQPGLGSLPGGVRMSYPSLQCDAYSGPHFPRQKNKQ